MNVKEELHKFLLTEVAISLDLNKRSFAPDEDLISAGIVDSMGILKLATFLEDKFGIKLTDEDIVPDNFRTLACLQKFIELRRQK